jgi:hypothetical protein
MASSLSEHTFVCQMYVTPRGLMAMNMPQEAGPIQAARLEPLDYNELIEPGFRRLLATFESLPMPLRVVQV